TWGGCHSSHTSVKVNKNGIIEQNCFLIMSNDSWTLIYTCNTTSPEKHGFGLTLGREALDPEL
ncbi:hypothetical protein AOLI_G00059740, partial [Acnodon oligacanthus]